MIADKGHLAQRLGPLAPTLVLVLAQAVWLAAVVGFLWRVGQPPLAPVRALWYVAMVLASIALLARAVRGRPADVWLAMTPAWASYVLWLAIDSPYAPWGAYDTDRAWVFIPLFAVLGALVGALYASPRLVLISATLLLGVQALAGWLSVRVGAGLMGNMGELAFGTLVVHAVGWLAAWVHRRSWPANVPGPWLASSLAAVVGGYVLWVLIDELPANGDSLGWLGEGVRMPANAWGAMRPVAADLALLAVAVAVVTLVAGAALALWRKVRPAAVLDA